MRGVWCWGDAGRQEGGEKRSRAAAAAVAAIGYVLWRRGGGRREGAGGILAFVRACGVGVFRFLLLVLDGIIACNVMTFPPVQLSREYAGDHVLVRKDECQG